MPSSLPKLAWLLIGTTPSRPVLSATKHSEDYIAERMVLFCNNVLAGVELSNALLEISATSDKILNTLSIFRAVYSETFLAQDTQGGKALIKGSLAALSRIRTFIANKHRANVKNSSLERALEDFFQSYVDFA